LLFLSFAFVPNVSARSSYNIISDPKARTKLALETLQSWYNSSTGLWESTGWWNGANIMTMIGDYAKADAEDEILYDMARHIFATALLEAPMKNPQPAIESPTSNSARLVTINATNIETGYMKTLDPDTNEPYTTYPPDWDEDRRVMLSQSSASREHSHLSYPTGPDPRDWLNGYYDDDLWWALAWLNAYDVTSNSAYLTLAEGIFIAVSRTWGTYCCNGGIYWSWEKKYVNAIANELFLSTAAHLARRVHGSKEKAVYLDWAERSLNWFLGSGMINEHGTINDGLTEACENNNKTAWSYNQGVILGGLVELYQASSSPSFAYLTLASDIASAALSALSDENGVIHDECEPDCGGDGAQFKGVFMRNLAKLHSVAPDKLYANAISVNAASIWKWDRRVTHEGLPMFSVDWAGPWVSPANASTHSSAMDALVAAIVAK
jgi:predicted alpha-1,6-mannanase (GH76 family)